MPIPVRILLCLVPTGRPGLLARVHVFGLTTSPHGNGRVYPFPFCPLTRRLVYFWHFSGRYFSIHFTHFPMPRTHIISTVSPSFRFWRRRWSEGGKSQCAYLKRIVREAVQNIDLFLQAREGAGRKKALVMGSETAAAATAAAAAEECAAVRVSG